MTKNLLVALKKDLYRLLGTLSTWAEVKEGSTLTRKQYSSYQKYLQQQKSKLGLIKQDLERYEEIYHEELSKRLWSNPFLKTGARVLCLAARLGAEVRAFKDHGCFALGIDLNPGKENMHVVYGDFHHLQFHDETVDIVFSNSFDHVYDLDKVMNEISRVLVPGGLLILEIVKGEEEVQKFGYWESLAWKKAEDLINDLTNFGYTVLQKTGFQFPWVGENITFQKT